MRARNEPVPETNAAVFRTLEREGVLDDHVATRMAQAAGFRNVLSYRSGAEIDDRDVYNVLQTDLPVFRQFLEQVREVLG